MIAFVLFAFSLYAQMPSIDDFLGPLDNDPAKGVVAPTKPVAPTSIAKQSLTGDGATTPVVSASSMQDAVLAGASTLKEGRETCLVIKVGSGMGYMAEGTASYKVFPNRNATLLSKRDAYMRAYLSAKANLARFLYGLTTQAQQTLDQSLSTWDNENASLANSAYVGQENIQQKVEGLIRGTVIYSINDDVQGTEISAIVVTTPKTRGETMQLNPGFILADSARIGMASALKDIKAGVVPPSGGKVIAVPGEKGEQFFFIAFGSEIIRTNKDKDAALQLKRNAFTVAEMRAAANMVGLIIGDQVSWNSGYSSTSIEENQQFQETMKTDPTSGQQSVSKIPLDATLKVFSQEAKTTNAYSSAQSGKLPPGVNVVRWESQDGDWAFVAMVYNPAITLDAAKVGEMMASGPGILGTAQSLTNKAQAVGTGSGATTGTGMGQGNTDNSKPVNQGPSGQVSGGEIL